ncbi:MAG: SPOR domain-containing protein [Muribaculaceae bacterium]|nr:SPOR domain-containing protein [Muribaculaceae bacterium]MCM1441791.1 SPOR domain-containing protein [Roseburia sp.]
MNDDNTMDLLDLDDGASMDALPDAAPFAAPRPKKPWLLLGIGLLVIVLATYIIVRTIGGDSSSSMDVDLDVPAIVVDGGDAGSVIDVNPNVRPDVVPVDVNVAPVAPSVPAQPDVAQPKPQPQPTVQPRPLPQPVAAPNDAGGVPTRVVEDRKAVTFNPDRPATTAKPKPAPKKAAQPVKPKPAKTVAASNGSWYVQFGSYSTRALAESAQNQIRRAHSALFQGKQFVILAAQMANGQTLYRLRVAFATSADANGFCRNAKSDGLDCYVAK